MAVCYRHSNRETGVSCSNCGNPICPDCMTPTPVGMRCPECSKQKTKVRNVAAAYHATPYVTYGLIAINVLIYFGMFSSTGQFDIFRSGTGTIASDYNLHGPFVPDEPYRLITSGFLHAQIPIHVGFNMYVLYVLGQLLEPSLGPYRFAGLYVAALLSGSLAVVLLQPDAYTVGASGAVFGCMGAVFMMQRARGIDPMQSGIGPMILLNFALGFFIANISIAGHLGGLIGGGIVGYLIDQAQSRRLPFIATLLPPVVVGAVSVAGAIAFA